MNKIAAKLIDFGIDFEYESRGSEGEKIVSFELGVEVQNQNGKIHFTYEGDHSDVEENERGYEYITSLVEKACIEETSSF